MEAFAVAAPTPVQTVSALRGYVQPPQVYAVPELAQADVATTGAAWSTSSLAVSAAFVGLLGGLLRARKTGRRSARRAGRSGVARQAADREPRLFLDTADTKMWERFLPQGWFYGVTCNPSILERSNLPVNIETFRYLYDKVQHYNVKQFFSQATGTDAETLYKNGKDIHLMGDKTVVKLPLTEEGLRAGRRLKDEFDATMCTTIGYGANHGFLASGLGAEYIAPYLGRLEGLSLGGMDRCRELHKIVGEKDGHTRVQVAAIRSANQMVTLAQDGLDTFTFGVPVAEELVTNEHVVSVAAAFEEAVERASKFPVPK